MALLRRLVYAALLVNLDEFGFLQLLLTVFTSVLLLIYLIVCKPFQDRYSNNLEIFNEISFLIICYTFIPFFESFSLDLAVKYNLGYIPIAFTLFFFVVNIVLILIEKCAMLIKMCKRLKAKLIAKARASENKVLKLD